MDLEAPLLPLGEVTTGEGADVLAGGEAGDNGGFVTAAPEVGDAGAGGGAAPHERLLHAPFVASKDRGSAMLC